MGQNASNIQVSALNIPINFTQATKVPMIYIRLPLPHIKMVQVAPAPGNNIFDIQNALNTIQPIMYNGKLESRMMSVAGTDGVLIVSIPRRTYTPMSGNIYNLPQVFNFANMPNHAFGLEVLNDTDVHTNNMLSIGGGNATPDDKFTKNLFIKSAVVLKQKQDNNNNNKSFIYGSKTYVIDYENNKVGVYDPIYDQNIAQNDFKPIRNISDQDVKGDFITKQTILIYTNELLSKTDTTKTDFTNIQNKYRDVNNNYNADNNTKYVGTYDNDVEELNEIKDIQILDQVTVPVSFISRMGTLFP
jgi:hypothetical protein